MNNDKIQKWDGYHEYTVWQMRGKIGICTIRWCIPRGSNENVSVGTYLLPYK